MKMLKTCKTGCGKMKSGGAVKKVKKMADGGQMYGIPQTGPTGPNYQGIDTMKKGGMIKKQDGGPTDNGRSVEKKTFSTSNKMYDLTGKKKTVSRDGETVKIRTKSTVTPNNPGSITTTGKPVTRVSVSKGDGPARTRRAIIPVKAKMGGATSFGMLSVKAGVDKNPKPTAADRIVGAKKKAKFGASVPVQHSPAPGRVRSSSGVGTVPVGARKKMGGTIRKKK
jgi:hypothetical protein